MKSTQLTQSELESISLMQTEGGLQILDILHTIRFTTANLEAWKLSDDEIVDFWDDVNRNWRDSGMTREKYIDRARNFVRRHHSRLTS